LIFHLSIIPLAGVTNRRRNAVTVWHKDRTRLALRCYQKPF